MAALNNADEPEMDLPPPDAAAQRGGAERKTLAKLIAALPEKWPVTDKPWSALRPVRVETASGEEPKILDDNSALFAAPGPATDDYTFLFDAGAGPIGQLRLEALTDPSLPKNGPGRVAHGNFVLSEIVVTAVPKNAPERAQLVKLARAGGGCFPEEVSRSKRPSTARPTPAGTRHLLKGPSSTRRTPRRFTFEQPVNFPTGTRLVVRLEQKYGQQHTLGRVRFSVAGEEPVRPVAERRREALDQAFAKWLEHERARTRCSIGRRCTRWRRNRICRCSPWEKMAWYSSAATCRRATPMN